MKTHSSSKLKTPPRQLFSCGIFSYCTPQTALSPTHTAPPLPLTPPPPTPPPPPPQSSSSSSSSTSTSQSFTQWRFPLPKSPLLHPSPPRTAAAPPAPPPLPLPIPTTTNLVELFHVAELHFSTNTESSHSRLSALHLLERSLVPNPPVENSSGQVNCPPAVMREVVGYLKDPAGARPATKVLLALCLAEGNREVAVEAGAVGEVVEALAELEGAAAERALAALELLCMVPEGAAELRAHALALPMLVEVMGKAVGGRGRECAISALSVVFGGGGRGRGDVAEVSLEAVARAVVLAMQGEECTARGRRKGAQLLRVLQESGTEDGGGS